MRKTKKEVLRLRFELRLGQRAIARACSSAFLLSMPAEAVLYQPRKDLCGCTRKG